MIGSVKKPKKYLRKDCSNCGKLVKKLIKVKVADEDGIGSIYVCPACAETVGTR